MTRRCYLSTGQRVQAAAESTPQPRGRTKTAKISPFAAVTSSWLGAALPAAEERGRCKFAADAGARAEPPRTRDQLIAEYNALADEYQAVLSLRQNLQS
jgi:hypothetical protein